MMMKMDQEEEEYWSKKQQECREIMQKEGEKIKDRPTSSFYRACSEYEKAMLHGYSVSQILDFMISGKPLKRKRRRG